ncbi:MAG: hypothetical protein E7376_01565 [Clostridiales bacterium]|nr:hypothetical protein [Clostridiales bacterium]
MKKKIISLNLLLCLSFLCICLTGCFSPRVEKLEVQYTSNIQFFVGEDWHDDLIKGTAIYSDDTEKDVTEDLNIDTSDYDKTQVGEYDIVFEYEDIEVKYQVKVVEEMTNLTSIQKRIEPCFQNAFKAQNGVLEFSATISEYVEEDLYLKQTIQYKLENNTLKEYYKLEYTNESESDCMSLFEILYVGDLTNGTLTNKYYTTDDDITYYYDVNSKQGTWVEFEEAIPQIATLYGASTYVDAKQWLNFYTDYYPNIYPLKLTKSANTYTIKLSNNQTIKIDNEGYMSEYCGIEFSKTTNIPSELTAE